MPIDLSPERRAAVQSMEPSDLKRLAQILIAKSQQAAEALCIDPASIERAVEQVEDDLHELWLEAPTHIAHPPMTDDEWRLIVDMFDEGT
jgi:hypothetical protein